MGEPLELYKKDLLNKTFPKLERINLRNVDLNGMTSDECQRIWNEYSWSEIYLSQTQYDDWASIIEILISHPYVYYTEEDIRHEMKRLKNQGNVTCVDPNKLMIEEGKAKLKSFKNIDWICAPAEKLPFRNNQFDYYTISFGIRNINNIESALQEAYRVLKPGGRFLCLEFSKVKNEILDKLYKSYSKSLPKIGKLIVGKSEPYEYLINSIEEFYSQEKLFEEIKKQNFQNVSYRNLTGGIVAIHSGWKV